MKRKDVLLTIFGIVIVIGYTYNIDIPQALQVPLRQPPYQLNTWQFNLLYFFCFAVIVVIDIPLGIILGKANQKKSLMIILVFSFLSQLGIYLLFNWHFSGYLIIVYVLRGIYGMLGQGVFTLQALILSEYAKKNYQIIYTFCVSTPFVFDALNSFLTPQIYDSTQSVPLAWLIGSLFGLVSLISGIFFIFYLRKLEAQTDNLSEASEQSQPEQQFKFTDFKKLGKLFWVIACTIFFNQSTTASFLDNQNQLIVRRFGISYTDSGTMLLIPWSFVVVFSLSIAFIIYKYPFLRRKIFVFSTTTYSLLVFLLWITPNTDSPSFLQYLVCVLTLFSLSLSIASEYSLIFTIVTFVVQKKYLGTAWGVIGCLIGLSQCIFPLPTSWILESFSPLADAYKQLTLFYFIFSIIPVLLAFYMFFNKKFSLIDEKLDEKSLKRSQIMEENIDSSLLTNEQTTDISAPEAKNYQ